MKTLLWVVLGIAAGAAALYVWQKRKAIEFAATHQDQISAASDVVGGLSDAWGGVEKLLGKTN